MNASESALVMFGGGIAYLIVAVFLLVLAITWLILPFILMHRLKKIIGVMEETKRLVHSMSYKMDSIDRSTKSSSENLDRWANSES